MQIYLIKNIHVVNEGAIRVSDVLIKNGRIEKIQPLILLDSPGAGANANIIEINGENKFLLPGAIDDQVHFREPGLTHKATIYTESKAAVAGGVTSFMEMPNTIPPAFTMEQLEEKYAIAAKDSLANYSFYIGTSNQNAEDTLKVNKRKNDVCGIKIFMGSSTGNLLVDNPLVLDKVFEESEILIATHCEDEKIIKRNLEMMKAGNRQLTAKDHPVIRNEDACFESSFYAIQLAKKHNSRLHILHISTEKELQLFGNLLPLNDKRITAEVCVHHLHFTSDDYERLGNKIKCNPAIKGPHNRDALWNALLDDRLDVIATDHAPHLLSEKFPNVKDISPDGPLGDSNTLLPPEAGSLEGAAGLPLVQHSLLLMLYYYKQGKISLEKIVQKMSHAVADCFRVSERGYIREGYFADLVIVDPGATTQASKKNILYKCGWSPLQGFEFPAAITHTFVNGQMVYGNGKWDESKKGERLKFER